MAINNALFFHLQQRVINTRLILLLDGSGKKTTLTELNSSLRSLKITLCYFYKPLTRWKLHNAQQ